jgi:ribosomal protein S26
MKVSSAKEYPKEGVSLVYSNGDNVILQEIFYTEDYGIFTRMNKQWELLSENDESLENMSIMDILPEDYKIVTEMFDSASATKTPLTYDNVKKYEVVYSIEGRSMTAAVETSEGCPPATQDIAINLNNRKNAIDTAMYGPLNPLEPNDEYWEAIADEWSVDKETAKKQLCGNCAVFIQTPKMLDCIASGLGNEEGNDAWGSIEAGDLGYCEAFDFKCAASRTCRAWVAGGPVTEESK